MTDVFDARRFGLLTGIEDVTVLEEVGSTNSYLRQYAKEKNERAVVIAKKQTCGRGRLGRSFISPENGLYMSILLKPQSAELASTVTAAAAVAVRRAIEKFSKDTPLIKWVNDILINGKKVCGILTETVFTDNMPEYSVLGIGINLHTPEGGFDAGIRDIAAAVTDDGTPIATELAAETVNSFFEIYGTNDHIDEYRRYSYLDGKTVTFERNGKSFAGTVIGVDDACGLIVKTSDEMTVLKCGEVSVKKGRTEQKVTDNCE